MRRDPLLIGLGTVGVLVLAGLALLATRGGRSVANNNGAPGPDAAPAGTAVPMSDADLLKSWAAGPFTALAGRNIRADLDTHLMLDLRAELSPDEIETLRAKLTAFLRAYSSTDFDEYLRYRDPATLCDKDHPQLAWLRDMARSQAPDAVFPEDPVDILRAAWTSYCGGQGSTTMQPGPFIDAVNWRTARATVRALSKRELVPDEWAERSGPEAHLHKELVAAGRRGVSLMAIDKFVPNRVSAADIAARDGRVIFADFELIVRRASDPPHPLLVRFVFDRQATTWLPLSAVNLWNGPGKVFFM